MSHIRQAPVVSISVSTQPDECLLDADSQLLGEHPGGLVDLGPVIPQRL